MLAIFPFLDTVSAGSSADRLARVAARLVQSALVELDQIEKLDDSLVPVDPLQFDRATVQLLRDAYERWVVQSESLIDRIDQLEPQLGHVPDAQRLRDACGKTRARLSISIDQMEQSMRALGQNRLVPSEEVRRELRLPVR